MLDAHSLDIISRFKQAVTSLAQKASAKPPSSSSYQLSNGNRGSKLTDASSSNVLKSKIVEYEGETHLVLSNESIARNTYRNKRKWSDYYNSQQVINNRNYKKINGSISNDNINDEVDSSEDLSNSDSSDDEGDENPFKKLKLSEILLPLAHPSEILSHPAILKTFKLNTLNKLAKELIDLIEIEQTNLNWLNKLLQILNGEDWFYLLEDQLGLEKYDHGLVQDDEPHNDTVEKVDEQDVKSEVDENKRITRNSITNDDVPSNPETQVSDPFFSLPKTLQKYEEFQSKSNLDENDELSLVQEDLVNYLQVGIQRQHEYIKTLTQIRNGIVKVDRYRQDLFKWGKEMHDKKSN